MEDPKLLLLHFVFFGDPKLLVLHFAFTLRFFGRPKITGFTLCIYDTKNKGISSILGTFSYCGIFSMKISGSGSPGVRMVKRGIQNCG
jgi:hypothetical protein